MEKKRMPLQHKIIFGYIILVAVIGSMYGHEIEMYTVEQGEKRDKRQ